MHTGVLSRRQIVSLFLGYICLLSICADAPGGFMHFLCVLYATGCHQQDSYWTIAPTRLHHCKF